MYKHSRQLMVRCHVVEKFTISLSLCLEFYISAQSGRESTNDLDYYAFYPLK